MLLAPTKTADDLILRFEAMRLRPYRDVRGLWTIGVGHLMDQSDVDPNQVMTEEQAMILFDIDVHDHWTWLDRLVHVELNTHQVDALTSFIFNIGHEAFAGSTMHRLIQAGQLLAASAEFGKWNHADGKVIEGLTRRRMAEKALYLLPVTSTADPRAA